MNIQLKLNPFKLQFPKDKLYKDTLFWMASANSMAKYKFIVQPDKSKLLNIEKIFTINDDSMKLLYKTMKNKPD